MRPRFWRRRARWMAGRALCGFLLGMMSPSTISAEAMLPKPVPFASAVSSGKLEQSLAQLGVLGRVLYIAAHPDDENTRLIAAWAQGRHYETAYFSLTRGSGGQNLIGPELGDALGVIRTHELLAARAIDGGRQFFTRAKDFGYSKHAEETLRIWNREAVLGDIVWVIRHFQPDVIVTRFSPEEGPTHGHHTASTQLALEAFDAAADPARFSEQLDAVSIWQARRILWNTSPWFFRGNEEAFESASWLKETAGDYLPRLGQSPGEIAALSRSMHKSQGFGAQGGLGGQVEHFQHLGGEPAHDGVFDGIDTSWHRIAGGARIEPLVRRAQAAFESERPWRILPELLALREELTALPEDPWATDKRGDVDRLIAQILGLELVAVSDRPVVVPGLDWQISLEAINRSPVPVKLLEIGFPLSDQSMELDKALLPNTLTTHEAGVRLSADADISQPYWLREAGTSGSYAVSDPTDFGREETATAFPIIVRLLVEDTPIAFIVPTVHRRVDPVRGEVRAPLVIAPPVFARFPTDVLLFTTERTREVVVEVGASAPDQTLEVRLELPEGWGAKPESIERHLARPGETQRATFTVTAPSSPTEGDAVAVLTTKAGEFRLGRQTISHLHIPQQTWFPPARARLVRLDLQRAGERIGYLAGAGDRVAESLREAGYQVDLLDPNHLTLESFAPYHAVVLGIRAANTIEAFANLQPVLFRYVEEGGTLIVQYNTSNGLKVDSVAPWPLRISRERVTDETAPITLLVPDHRAFHFPNRITPADFDGWVQERGLYFADQWDEAFVPLIASSDSGEEPLAGGLLVARHGAGHIVYTGYAWFRQLPAGVPGAYRLFINLLSLGADA